MNIIRRNIPNAVTCLNLLSGVIAIIFAFHPDTRYGALDGWLWSVTAIGCAAVFDFLDGFCARLLHAYSDMGKELDSLCDLVSFGVAPALLIMNILLASGICSPLAAWVLLVIPIAGALRLARFNIDTRQTSSFIGLPIPANAIFWSGYAAMLADGASFLALPAVAVPAALLLAWLMVSPLRLFSLKVKSLKWQGNQLRFLLVGVSAILICWLGLKSLCLIILIYIVLATAGVMAGHEE